MNYFVVQYAAVDGEQQEVECLISDETIELLLITKPPRFIKVIVDDGEIMLIPTEDMGPVTQVYKTAH